MPTRSLLCFVLSIFACGYVLGNPAGRSSLQIDTTVRDLGIVGDNEPAFAEFTVRNRGTAPLHLDLSKAAPGLKKPVATIDIPPKSKRTIRIEPETTALDGPSSLSAEYTTSDPKYPLLTLEVKVDVKPFVLAVPGTARYIYVQMERPGTIDEKVFATDDRPFTITSIESSAPWLTGSFRKATDADTTGTGKRPQWIASITILSNAPVGLINQTVRFNVDHPKQHSFIIPVSGFVRPVFAITPQSADFGQIRIGQQLDQNGIYVQNFASEQINLTDVRSDVPGFDITVDTIDPGHRYRLHVNVTDRAKTGPFAGTITIHTSSPKVEYLDIPIRGEFIQ